MKIRTFEAGPHPNKKAAMKEAINNFVLYYKANNLTSKNIISIVPLVESSQFGYIITLWSLLED